MQATVAIPLYNDAATLGLAIRSVFAQTESDWELLLVDDGSQDGTLTRIQAIRDPRVTVIADGKNRGLAYRLNEISRNARSEFLFRMDADDAMHPERIRRQLARLRRPGVDVLATRAYALDQNDRAYGMYREHPIPDHSSGWLSNGIITHPTVAARTEWFREHPYDESMRKTQDKDLWLRSSANSRFEKLSEPLLFYRVRGNVSLDAYLRNCRYDRLVTKRHGPELIGSLGTNRALVRSHLKAGLAAASYAFGFADRFQQRRVETMNHSDVARAQTLVSAIQATSVPGWPDKADSSTHGGQQK